MWATDLTLRDPHSVVTVEWWEEQCVKTPGLPAYSPTISDGVPVAQVQASTRAIVGPLWLGEPDRVLGALASATQMWVKYASRDTIARNAALCARSARCEDVRVLRDARLARVGVAVGKVGWH